MYNNEEIGVSAEVAIADVFNVAINAQYRLRSRPSIVSSLTPAVIQVFSSNGIPTPVLHIAEGQNPIDFILAGSKTLSVKTNQKQLGKVAPQRVGQASSTTFFPFFASVIPTDRVPALYADKVLLFKASVFASIDAMLEIYWNNLFDCDYLVHFYEILSRTGEVSGSPKAVVFSKTKSPHWDRQAITFTKNSVEAWNESNTVKYHGVTIGEFQIHNNRDNFKFRFNMAGIASLTKLGII